MTTSTLELVDWATILDDEPACQVHGCDATATHVIIGVCGCAFIKCLPCVEADIRWLTEALREWGGVRCSECLSAMDGRVVSDVATVVPL